MLLKTTYFIFLIAGSFLFITGSCRHQKKMVDAHEKKLVKKEEPVKKDKDLAPGTSKNGRQLMEQKLGLTPAQIEKNKLYSFVEDWYGSPYKYGGCQKSGVDCSCFAGILYEKVYGRELSRTAGEMFTVCDKIGPEQAKEGDLFFFKINGNTISHVGVYLKNNYFVHSSSSSGVVMSSLNEAYYKKYFFCAGRVKKV